MSDHELRDADTFTALRLVIPGTAYGVVLNDRQERARLNARLSEMPYDRPPEAPVVYIKPRTCLQPAPACIRLPDDVDIVEVASTIALLFARDANRIDAAGALSTVAGAALAIDVSVPAADYYRPTVLERCCDGFLPLTRFGGTSLPSSITTVIDGTIAHEWSLDRLVRSAAQLIADLSGFMTLRAGDLLLIGVPGDPPAARAGQSVELRASGMATLRAQVVGHGA